MSELTTAARPYAKAVFELARDSGSLDQWSELLQGLATVVSAPNSAEFLANPKLSRAQKVDVFADVLGADNIASAQNLLNTLAENDRFALLPEMSQLFETFKAEDAGAIEAEIISATELTEEQQATFSKALQKRLGKDIKLITHIDPTIMGGAIIRAGDLVIDGSVKSRLKSMQTSLNR